MVRKKMFTDKLGIVRKNISLFVIVSLLILLISIVLVFGNLSEVSGEVVVEDKRVTPSTIEGIIEQINTDSIAEGNIGTKDIIVNNKFNQLNGFKQVEFTLEQDNTKIKSFNKENLISSKTDLKNKFTSDSIEVKSIYEEVDTGFFNVDEKPVKQTYVLKNLLNTRKDVKLNILYEIESSSVIWNGTEYTITNEPIYFKAFNVTEEMFPGLEKTHLTGHTLYFGNNYYDFKDVIGLNYKVGVYSLDGKSYIDLEVKGGVEGLGEFVVDPVIGWTSRIISTSADGATSVFAIDVDNDNDMDVLSASAYDDKIAWYENNGSSPPGWTTRIITTSAYWAQSVFAIDIDNDNDTDVLSASLIINNIDWYENNGNTPPSWTRHTISTSASGAESVFAIDIDNDNDIDVLSASSSDDKIAWYENNGGSPPGWTTRIITTSADAAHSVYAIDIDNDNDVDVLSASFYDDKIAWYENNGSSPPGWTSHNISTSADSARSVFAIDIDNDNDIDVLSASELDGKVAWYENNGSSPPGWTSHNISTSAPGAISVFAIDIDDDNDIDVLSASTSDDKIAWYENNGGSPPGWTSHNIITSADYADFVFAIDVDKDNDIDVLSASMWDDKIVWYESNLSSSPNCSIPDGSSWNCECDVDADCPGGYYCDQSSGPDACEQTPTCNGTIQVITEDSYGAGIESVKVYLNSSLQGTTDNLGTLDLDVTSSCGVQQDIDVKCSDDTFCDNGNAAIDYDGEENPITFDCSLCISDADLFISQQDIVMNYSSDYIPMTLPVHATSLNVQVSVHSLNINASNLKVRFQLIGTDGLIKDTYTDTINISANSEVVAKADFLSLENIIYITIYVDPSKEFDEVKTNNFVRRTAVGRIKAYLDIDTKISKADEAIEDFLGAFINPVSEANADVIISVGRFSNNIENDISENKVFIDDNGWGIKNKMTFVNGKLLDAPYNGVVGSYEKSGKSVLVAYGTDIDGTIAAVKKMAGAGSIYFNKGISQRPTLILDDTDLTALSVYDILHNLENNEHYKKNTDNFKEAVSKVLGGNTYDVAIRRVNTTNANSVTLRIKNINSEFSESYKDNITDNSMPVVFSAGLFSDLEVWEGGGDGLAKQLAEDGRDSWEIEITGGPLAERNNDPDYTYQDLVDEYWPASMAAVQYHTGEITTQYVGHSNGCRVALSSLNSYQETGKANVSIVENLQTGNPVTVNLQASESTPVVDTFVGVACPAELNGGTFLSNAARHNVIPFVGPDLGDAAMALIFKDHITMRSYTGRMLFIDAATPLGTVVDDIVFITSLFGGSNKISRNLMDYYNDLSIDENSDFNVSDLNVSKLRLYYANFLWLGHDGVVPTSDMDVIYDSVVSGDKDKKVVGSLRTWVHHSNVKDKEEIKNLIKEDLK